MRIISPCNENFNKMLKHGDGRYCQSCSKVVVDFTQMSNAQMLDYFEKHKGESICGRARNIQLGKQNAFESFLFKCRQIISDKINITPLRLALLAGISGLLTFTTSCMGKMADPLPKNNLQSRQDTIKDQSKREPGKNH